MEETRIITAPDGKKIYLTIGLPSGRPVARYLRRRGFRNLYAVGHSFGGLTLLQADCKVFRAISLWDPSSFVSYPAATWLRKDRVTGATYILGAYEPRLETVPTTNGAVS